jgi:hypothetical protein
MCVLRAELTVVYFITHPYEGGDLWRQMAQYNQWPPGRGVEQNISMDAIRVELVSIAESGYRDVVPFRQNICRLPYPMGWQTATRTRGRMGISPSANPAEFSQFLTLSSDQSHRRMPENYPPFRTLHRLSQTFDHCHLALPEQ